ncbi:GntR family transcriptional regulator [Lacibacterium aquatile]|uniref:GntR family transcriptional regulator n=1 Tax=Lacibacterium aquatile TaxID=1168082 RepID=A0ABW5DSG6_9PROT
MADTTDRLNLLIAASKPRFRTATEFVEATLKAGIIDGSLPAGTPLRQEDLATRFQVSRMPVREALRQLESQALVDFHPHRGAIVAELSAADSADVASIRVAVETAALSLSIPRLTEEDLNRAEELLAEMDSEPTEALGELNHRFHLTLMSRAGHPRLLTLVEQHLALADRYVRFLVAARGHQELSQDDHSELLAAARARDIPAACAIVTRHIEEGHRSLHDFLTQRTS